MSWGAMMGLGDGLQALGKMQLDKMLEEKREARADERELKREQRQADRERTTPDARMTEFIERDGVWYEQVRSKQGNVLEERLAPQNKVREFLQQQEDRKRAIEKEALEARKLGAQAGKAEKELEYFDADRDFDMRQQRERTAAMRDRASGRGGGFDSEPSQEEVVSLLMKENKPTFDALAKQYEDLVSPTDLSRMTRTAIRDAYARGINPNAHLQEVLRFYEDRLKKQKGAATPATVGGAFARSLDN